MLILTSETDALARFGRALADPLRCRILVELRRAPAHPADLATRLDVSRSRLSNHLACLRGCGLVVAVPVGRRVRYELADSRLVDALASLQAVALAIYPDVVCIPPGEDQPSG